MASPEQNAARRAKRNYAAEYQARLARAQAAGHPSVRAERVSRVQEFARKIREQLFPLTGRRQTSVSGPLSSFRAQRRALANRRFDMFSVRIRLSNGKWIQGRQRRTAELALHDAREKAARDYQGLQVREIELVGFSLLGRAS